MAACSPTVVLHPHHVADRLVLDASAAPRRRSGRRRGRPGPGAGAPGAAGCRRGRRGTAVARASSCALSTGRRFAGPARLPHSTNPICPFAAATTRLADRDVRSRGQSLRVVALPALRAQRPACCRRCRSGCGTTSADERPFETQRAIVRRAFDLGITHFDLANNYGPPYGSAEENFGRILAADLGPYRDELVISTKAGYDMWPGPYGDHGSRKYLLASLDQSLAPDGTGLRRHLLLAPVRPGHAARGDDGRARRGRSRWQGALRRDLLVQLAPHPGGGGDPAPARARRC